ncbi:glycosyltransferase [Enterobacter sp. RIT418]|uniref:glycosyltransferase n=1 Tax=Enterobacter sp. RIT418 TaxID=2202164 RepID=UPI000D4A876C|nr:glycosyltransferase [Enterobacter sp. RIT 418]RAU35779.1 glycosyl transferase [Enterobacter sp. RIT 418]
MINKIDISVIIPVFNAQDAIVPLVAKLLSEKTASIEIIVVNDGSTDATEAVLRTLDDERLIVISQNNQGVYAARNAALAVHRGEWVIFLDADDRIEDHFLPERFAIACEAQADVVIFNGWRGDSTHPVHHKQPYRKMLSGWQWIHRCVNQREWPHYLWLQMVRSSYIRQNNLSFQAGKSHKDIVWTLHLAAENGRFYFSDRKDYLYINNPASITHRQDYYDVRATSYIEVIAEILTISMKPEYRDIKYALARHALVETRHFLGLYRRKVSSQRALQARFRSRIGLQPLISAIRTTSDVFFLLKLAYKMYMPCLRSARRE